jgi:hypothetical protein
MPTQVLVSIVPLGLLLICLALIPLYPITEEGASITREKLQARRLATGAAGSDDKSASRSRGSQSRSWATAFSYVSPSVSRPGVSNSAMPFAISAVASSL